MKGKGPALGTTYLGYLSLPFGSGKAVALKTNFD